MNEWRSDPLSIRKGTIAICQIDILVEHLILHTNPPVQGMRREERTRGPSTTRDTLRFHAEGIRGALADSP